MGSAMKTQRKLLLTAGVLMLLTAVVHTIGNFAPVTDPSQIALENTMAAFHFPLGLGMNPSMHDVLMLLVLVMTVTFAGFGILNIAVASTETPVPLLRRILFINIAWVAAFIAVSAFYQVPPPLISGVVIELPLLAALVIR